MRLAYEAPRRVDGDQTQDHAALGLGQPRPAPGAGAITQPVEPLAVEAEQALAHRLRVAAQLPRDGGRPEAVPTPCDHPGAADPIPRRVPAPGQLPNAALLGGIEWRSSTQQLRHGDLPTLQAAPSIPQLRNGALALLR